MSQRPLSRGEATRARIREAANVLFLRDGIEATTVEAIAAAAAYLKATFYLYFQRKEGSCCSSTACSDCGGLATCFPI